MVLQFMARLEGQATAAGGHVHIIVGDHDAGHVPFLWRRQAAGVELPAFLSLAVVVEGVLFVHGSLHEPVLALGGSLDAMNAAVRQWLGGGTQPDFMRRTDNPLWSRAFSLDEVTATLCDELTATLARLNATRMVVGHTVRPEGISSVCAGRVWRIDAGLAKRESPAGSKGASQVLKLEGGRVQVLGLNEGRMPKWTSHSFPAFASRS